MIWIILLVMAIMALLTFDYHLTPEKTDRQNSGHVEFLEDCTLNNISFNIGERCEIDDLLKWNISRQQINNYTKDIYPIETPHIINNVINNREEY